MHLQIHIIIGLVTYVVSCKLLEPYDIPYTKQRRIAFRRTLQNFVYLALLSLLLTFYGYRHLPTISRGLKYDFIIAILWLIMAETLFSVSHYTLHSKYLYWIHKQHHENNPTYSTSCLDAHPLEFIFGNVGTIIIPMVLLPASDVMSMLFVLFAVVNTASAHCSGTTHATHHSLFKYNYGQGGYVFDRLIGTYVN